MNYIITCGGTGGHINPAIAIADALKEKDKNSNILFIGNENGMEMQLVPKAGYEIKSIRVSGISRSLSPKNLISAAKAVIAVRKCDKIITDFSPDAVIGTGGYVCYPMLKAASNRKIFTAIHESNAIPGLAVKLLKKHMSRIYTNFEECGKALGSSPKIIRTGNPRRVGLDPLKREKYRSELGVSGNFRYVILSFGGSLGAETINREMLSLMKSFSSKHPEVLHVHATGNLAFEDFVTKSEELGLKNCKNICVSGYFYNLPMWMTCADVVICRSGAMTLSEIASSGRASILMPSPNVVDNHQYKNAKAFEDGGASFLVNETADELKRIPELVKTLLYDKKIRQGMEQNALKFAFNDASDIIARDIMVEAKKYKKSRQLTGDEQ